MANITEYIDPSIAFAPCEADEDAPLTTGPGLTAALKKVDPGLFIGRHRKLGYYAIMRRPWISVGKWAVPVLDKKPVLVWELRDDYGQHRAQELGEWVVRLARQADLSRQGYESPRDYALEQYEERGRELEEAEELKQVDRQERFDEMFDRIRTRVKGTRTIHGWRPEGKA